MAIKTQEEEHKEVSLIGLSSQSHITTKRDAGNQTSTGSNIKL